MEPSLQSSVELRPFTLETTWTDLESRWGPISLRELGSEQPDASCSQCKRNFRDENYLLKMTEDIMEFLEEKSDLLEESSVPFLKEWVYLQWSYEHFMLLLQPHLFWDE